MTATQPTTALALLPDRTKMYGLLHNLDGSKVPRRQVRSLKVGIGVPKGKDVHVWIDNSWKWCIESGKQVHQCDNKDDAKRRYAELRKTASEREYPRKLPYFTFLRLGIDASFMPDFDAIEQHGPMPTEIDIVFLKDDPLDASYQWWTAANLKCEGDGRTARRRVEEAKTAEEKVLAADASSRGERFFPILEGCFALGCPVPRGEKKLCKPHARLSFSLLKSPSIGGTCTFDTTGFRSIDQMDSCLNDIRMATGGGEAEMGHVAGIPLKLLLRPYKTAPPGKPPAVQYAVSMEFRGSDAVGMMKLLKQHAEEFRAQVSMAAQPLQLTAGLPLELDDDDQFPDEASEAAALTAEFYVDEPQKPAAPTGNAFVVVAKAAPVAEATSNGAGKAENPPELSPAPAEPPKASGKGSRSHAKAAETSSAPQPEPPPPGPVAHEAPATAFKATDADLPAEMTPGTAAPVSAAKPEPKPPTQLQRFVAITTQLAKDGNRPEDETKKAMRAWIMAFSNMKEFYKPPQKEYDIPLDFLEGSAKANPQGILADPHSAGVASGTGYQALLKHIASMGAGTQFNALKAAAKCYPDDPALLIEFLTAAAGEGELPERETLHLLVVLAVTDEKTAWKLKGACDAASVSMESVCQTLTPFSNVSINSAIERMCAAAIPALADKPKENWD